MTGTTARRLFQLTTVAFALAVRTVGASEADDTTVTITSATEGATPFIHQLKLNASDTSVIKSIKFSIAPKPGSVTRPLSGTYANAYLVARGYVQANSIFIPVYGLYADYTNSVTLTYTSWMALLPRIAQPSRLRLSLIRAATVNPPSCRRGKKLPL